MRGAGTPSSLASSSVSTSSGLGSGTVTTVAGPGDGSLRGLGALCAGSTAASPQARRDSSAEQRGTRDLVRFIERLPLGRSWVRRQPETNRQKRQDYGKNQNKHAHFDDSRLTCRDELTQVGRLMPTQPWRLIDRAQVPNQAEVMELVQRGEEFVLRVGGRELMSSRVHGSED